MADRDTREWHPCAVLHVVGPRPLYRGVSHRFAFFAALIACPLLVACADGLLARTCAAIYGTCLATMFGVSATLHRADWPPRAYSWLRRADHAAIFLCIAGTYTPFALLGVGGDDGRTLALIAWMVCGAGVLRALLWPHAPRALTASCFVIAGWVVIAYLPELRAAIDTFTFASIVAGGVMFTVGAAIYLLRWPDPNPRVFGYHEVFHLVVIVACGWHFMAVARLIAR
jgi:hemolysin III